MAVLVVGAGISGLACAQALRTRGIAVRVVDRTRVLGGRMASPRWEGRVVDLGASYFTVDDAGFAAALQPLLAAGVVRPWTVQFTALDAASGVRRISRGPMRYGAKGGLRSVVAALAGGLVVEQDSTVGEVSAGPAVGGLRFDAVVLAMPAPQALSILAESLPAERGVAAAQEWKPVLTLAARFTDVPTAIGDGVFVNNHDVLAFVAHDGRRRGDHAPVLVVHTTEPFAARRLADPAAAEAAIVAALREVLDLPAPAATYLHRWTYAKPAAPGEKPFHLGAAMVGLCGDAYGVPKVETAWRSGTLLGEAIASRLG